MGKLRLKDPGPPLSESALNAVEQRIGIRLPDDLRAFYLQSNGGVPEAEKVRGEALTSVLAMLGPDAGFEQIYKSTVARGGYLPAHLIPFALFITGDAFVYDTSPEHYGKVRLTLHENFGNEERFAEEVAPSLADFFERVAEYQ